MLFSSCSKSYLDTVPTGSIGESTALGSLDNLDMAVEGCYLQLADYSSDDQNVGSGYAWFKCNGDLFGGTLVRNINDSYGWWWPAYDLSIFTNPASTNYRSYYAWKWGFFVIRNINAIVLALPKLDVTSDAQKIQAANILAQCYAIRAYVNFEIGSWFAYRWEPGAANTQLSVPLRVDTGMENLPRATLTDIYAQVESDIALALTNFTASGKPAVTDKINEWAIKMLKARLQMVKHDFAGALVTAKDIIDNSGRSIMGIKNYGDGFNTVANPEWIWGAYIDATTVSWYNSFWSHWATNTASPYAATSPFSVDLAYTKIMESDDLRLKTAEGGDAFFLTDTRAEIATNGPAYYNERGWTGTKTAVVFPGNSKKFRQREEGVNGLGDILWTRLAEAYYIAAEAAAQSSTLATAATYLEGATTPYDADFKANVSSKDNFLTQLYAYKKIDMVAEGRSYEDVKRRGSIVYRNLPGTTHIPTNALLLEYGPLDGQPGNEVFKMGIGTDISNNNSLIVTD